MGVSLVPALSSVGLSPQRSTHLFLGEIFLGELFRLTLAGAGSLRRGSLRESTGRKPPGVAQDMRSNCLTSGNGQESSPCRVADTRQEPAALVPSAARAKGVARGPSGYLLRLKRNSLARHPCARKGHSSGRRQQGAGGQVSGPRRRNHSTLDPHRPSRKLGRHHRKSHRRHEVSTA
jgi:hypothetical protein